MLCSLFYDRIRRRHMDSTTFELAYISILRTIGRRVHRAACVFIAFTEIWRIVVFMSVGLVVCV
jgi:hypothetical protein